MGQMRVTPGPIICPVRKSSTHHARDAHGKVTRTANDELRDELSAETSERLDGPVDKFMEQLASEFFFMQGKAADYLPAMVAGHGVQFGGETRHMMVAAVLFTDANQAPAELMALFQMMGDALSQMMVTD